MTLDNKESNEQVFCYFMQLLLCVCVCALAQFCAQHAQIVYKTNSLYAHPMLCMSMCIIFIWMFSIKIHIFYLYSCINRALLHLLFYFAMCLRCRFAFLFSFSPTWITGNSSRKKSKQNIKQKQMPKHRNWIVYTRA